MRWFRRRPRFGRAIKEMEATRERLAEAKRLQLNARAQHQHAKEVKRLMTELLRRERAAGMFS